MCVEIFFDSSTTIDDHDIGNIGELKARYGAFIHPEDLDEDATFTEDDICLCGVDVEAILKRAGVTYQWDPFGWRVPDG